MFDVSNPQQRERLLVIAAGIALFVIVLGVLPAQFSETTKFKKEREKLLKEIENLHILAKNKEEIQNRLRTMETQALAYTGNETISRYHNWLADLARNAGLQFLGGPAPTPSGATRDIYKKHTFTINVAGKLDQIAEFLRCFHSADYLHQIQSFPPRPSTTNPGEFSVTVKIDVLALPRTRGVNIPESTEISDDEETKLSTISHRAILSPYQPPALRPPTTPPPPPFFDHPYCYVNGIVKVDGKPQCWIDIRTTGKKYYLFEDESFTLGATRSTIKKIDVAAQRVLIAADGNVYAIRCGNNFDQHDEHCYFVTLVDTEGNPWSAESTGKPLCSIEYDPGNVTTNVKEYLLDEEQSFPMKRVHGTIKKIDPATRLVQIEADGVVYTLKHDGAFPEFVIE